MYKLVPLLFGGITSMLCAVGSYLDTSAKQEDIKAYAQLMDFTQSGGCKSFIREIEPEDPIEPNPEPIKTDYLGAPIQNKVKGCLDVSWKKKSLLNNKEAEFIWIWVFLNGTKGFVTFNQMKFKGDNKGIAAGITYILEAKHKHSEVFEGTVKQTKESATKEIDDNNFDFIFPKSKTVGKEYWKFTDSEKKVSQLFNFLSSPSYSFQEGIGTPELDSSQNQSIVDGVEGSDFQWGDNMYEESFFDLQEFKGKWVNHKDDTSDSSK